MSMANRPTTKAEEAILEANGFYKSPLESMGDYTEVDGESLYCGNWFHREHPVGEGHMCPDEALQFLQDRLREHSKNNP